MSSRPASNATFLLRGDADWPETVAVGPSVIFDHDTSTPVAAAPLTPPPSSRVPPDGLYANLSPMPSQLLMDGATLLPRQRPRFQSVQDLDLALNQAIEGKITARNAWASKEASDLLQGITHTIESTLDANHADDYSGFTKVATVVEGCSKVWTIRVDSTYHQSSQMVQRLLRREETSSSHAPAEDSADGDRAHDGDGGGRRRGKSRPDRAAALGRSLALTAAEINLDRKARTALTQTSINAQFRAVTERFDQGNAQGLLLSNAPLGALGNLILDVDYARGRGEFSTKNSKQTGKARRAHDAGVKAEPGEGEDGDTVTTASLRPSASLPIIEHDAAGRTTVTDFPPFSPPPGPIPDLSNVSSITGMHSALPSMRSSALLALPHSEIKEEPANAILHSLHASRRASMERPPIPVVEDNQEGQMGTVEDDYGCDDWGMDNAEEDASYDEETGAAPARREDVGAVARQLVSGASEIARMDALFGGAAGVAQLALEAEDPSSWCPLTKAPTNGLVAAVGPRSELFRLRREHQMSHQHAKAASVVASEGQPPAKRSKKDRTVVFDLSEAAEAASPTFFHQDRISSSALKQSATTTKNVTPLGREILLGKDASHAILPYTQSHVQHAKAAQAGLLLPVAPTPGGAIPAYLAYPISIEDFFQPFSTALPQWNLLRKSATGHVIHPPSLHGGHGRGGAPRATAVGVQDDDEDGSCLGDMPVDAVAGAVGVEQEEDNGYGYEDLGGADDYDADEDYRREHQHILAQFDAAATAGMVTSAVSSSRTSGGAASGPAPLRAAVDIAAALQSPHAIMPTQVDVVHLREVMWEAVQSVARRHPTLAAQLEGCGTSGRGAQYSAGGGGATGGRAKPKPPAERLLKGHVRAMLNSRLSRSPHNDEDGSSREEAEENAATSSTNAQATMKALTKRRREEDVEDDQDGVPLPRLCDVVQAVLPLAPAISSTGTLSPAFLFFSILFLANEHHIVLGNVPALNDLIICGFATPITAA